MKSSNEPSVSNDGAIGATVENSKSGMSHRTVVNIHRIILLAPAVALYFVFNFFPLVSLPFYSLIDWAGIGPVEFVGFDNFQSILFNEYYRKDFFNALFQNIQFFLTIMTIFVIIGTGLALLLSFKTPGKTAYQTIFFLAYPIAAPAVAFMLQIMVSKGGPIAEIMGFMDLKFRAPLGNEDWALTTIAGMYSWHRMGFAMMFILSGILAVRIDLIEAAMLDGAERWQTIRHIIMPVLAPAYIAMTVIIMVDVFNNADYVLLLQTAEAGPRNSTDLLGTFIYRQQFGSLGGGQGNYGKAAAGGILTACVILPPAIWMALKNLRNN